MYNILTLNKIAACGMAQLPGENYKWGDDIKEPDAIILRSFSMHDMELPVGLKAIARAGAGVNNIPLEKCSEEGIVVFNTPGANANAVKELTIAALLLSSRKVVNGIEWAKTLTGEDVPKQVEKGKSAYAGPEIMGKTLGVLGLGAIGVMVANAAASLGMEVIGYDPYISVDAAWGLSSGVKKAVSIKEIYEHSDYITLHMPLTPETKGTINADATDSLKDGVRILNFSRGELVDDDFILEATASGKVSCYVTDFPNVRMLNQPSIIAIPHLGASTPESEDNCAVMAAKELRDFLENGNIVNSVNFPNCVSEREAPIRLCITHKNVPNVLKPISEMFAENNINIEHMLNKSRGNYAYTILDSASLPDDGTLERLRAMDNVLKVRVIGG